MRLTLQALEVCLVIQTYTRILSQHPTSLLTRSAILSTSS
jgi:hypothetical protein